MLATLANLQHLLNSPLFLFLAFRLVLAVEHFGEHFADLVLIVPRQKDVPIVRHALELVGEYHGIADLAQRAYEYDPAMGVRADFMHVISWRQEAVKDDPDQNDLWSDFLPTQVRKENSSVIGLH